MTERPLPLLAALAYAAKGWPILPCNPAGRPFPTGGLKAASSSEARIRRWWHRWPEARIGLPLGALSNTMVIEIEPGPGLPATERGIREGIIQVGSPRCIVLSLPNGNAQVFFKLHPNVDRLTAAQRELGNGIRVLAAGDIAVLPETVGADRSAEIPGTQAAGGLGPLVHAGSGRLQ